MSDDATARAISEIVAAIEKQTGQKVEYYTVCTSVEDSPEFQRIANIGISTPCASCTTLSANCCYFCDMALCAEHSHDAISDDGHDVYACAHCVEGLYDFA